MTRQDWADVALVVALGAPEQPPAMAVSDKGAA